jgi:hypothetical protein
MSNASVWLAGRGMDATRLSRVVTRDHVDGDSRKTITKRRMANKRLPKFLVRRITSSGNFKTMLLTHLLIVRIWGFDNSLFLRC